MRLKSLFTLAAAAIIGSLGAWSADFEPSHPYYIMHTGGMMLSYTSQSAVLANPTLGVEELKLVPSQDGWYNITAPDGKVLQLSGSYNTVFALTDPEGDAAQFQPVDRGNDFIAFKCKANGKYIGTDNLASGSWVFADKNGEDTRHWWILTEDPNQDPPMVEATYILNPDAQRQLLEGWGVSLCWWANMCGKWSDFKIDEIIDWLVSPEGLNYNIFRYNIGGGDDPDNANCDPHHMGSGKGLRAEMEGFKDSSSDSYHWDRDAAQRKIMLKIKEKRPDAIFEAFSNSAPWYMTYSGCCAGNTNASKDNLKPEYYLEFANYLVDVCKHYKDEYGIEFKTLDPFNEPMTNYWGANGGQEGCHFDVASQIAFLKVLAPVLKASGLKTVISASDETDVAQAVRDFQAFLTEGNTLDLVGQYNTHTYSASQASRTQLAALCQQHGKHLWMSEVGLGGDGLSGNLELMQKLMDDIRYLMPAAWLDWQYVEEGTDQWCTVMGDFNSQSYNKVKNYYLHQQITRYIIQGYTFLTTTNGQTLAAISPLKDEVVLVAMNPSAMEGMHHVDMGMFETIKEASGTRTSSFEDNAECEDFEIEGSVIHLYLEPMSVTTLVVKVATGTPAAPEEVMIVPRMDTELAITAADGKVTIEQMEMDSAAQTWSWVTAGSGKGLVNANGVAIVATTDYQLSTGAESQASPLEAVDLGLCHCKLMEPAGNRGFDLEGAKCVAGTRVGMYAYGDSDVATHRQWQIVPALRTPDPGVVTPDPGEDPGEDPGDDTGIGNVESQASQLVKFVTEKGLLTVEVLSPCALCVYDALGCLVYTTSLQPAQRLLIPLASGVYYAVASTPASRTAASLLL